jgi:hypothetical protein
MCPPICVPYKRSGFESFGSRIPECLGEIPNRREYCHYIHRSGCSLLHYRKRSIVSVIGSLIVAIEYGHCQLNMWEYQQRRPLWY